MALTSAVYLHLAFAWPDFGPTDPALRIGGWRDLAARVFATADGRPVLADGYAATAVASTCLVALETGQRTPVQLEDRPAFYDTSDPLVPVAGRTG